MAGGGSSIDAAVLAESCLAKSDACHHSRNLRKNMEVGRRIFSESRIGGRTRRVRAVAERRDEGVSGVEPGRGRVREAASKARYFFRNIG